MIEVPPSQSRNVSPGFTLVELAIVLFIITLLLGGVLTPLGQQISERQTGDTRRALESARIALVGYALRRPDQAGPLPCPDVRADVQADVQAEQAAGADKQSNDGLEDRMEDGRCAALSGNLPWKTLSLAEGDAWGNRLGYAVALDWTQTDVHSGSAKPALQVCLDSRCNAPIEAAAVLISHGRNGFGAVNVNGGINLPPSSADERENSNADPRYVMHPPRAIDRPGGEFDDLLLPLSADWLRGRLCDPASLCRGG